MRKLVNLFSKSVSLMLMFTLSGLSTNVAFSQDRIVKIQIDNTTATINNENVIIDVAPYISNENTMIPLRFVANALNISDDNIVFDVYTKSIYITKDSNTEFIFQVGSDKITTSINGEITEKVMENFALVEVRNDRTFVPFRELANAFELAINWDSDTKTVILVGSNIPDTSENMQNDNYIDVNEYINNNVDLNTNTNTDTNINTNSSVLTGVGSNSEVVDVQSYLDWVLNNSNLTGTGSSSGSIDVQAYVDSVLNNSNNSNNEIDLDAYINANLLLGTGSSSGIVDVQTYLDSVLNNSNNSNNEIDLDAYINANLLLGTGSSSGIVDVQTYLNSALNNSNNYYNSNNYNYLNNYYNSNNEIDINAYINSNLFLGTGTGSGSIDVQTYLDLLF